MKLVFEVATVRDAITKAARIAPTRGSALEKAAGILITVEDGQVSIRATNGLVFYHEVVDVVEVEGSGEWRLPSVVTSEFFAKLPIGSGKNVTIKDDGSGVRVTSGTKRAVLRLIPSQHFPDWEVFDPEGLQPVENMKEVIDAVRWAASKEQSMGAMCGIHFDGQYVYATDRYRIAKFQCEIPLIGELEKGITVPTSVFDPISKTLGEVMVGVSHDGHMLIMPDEQSQVKAVIYDGEYPPVTGGRVKSNQPNEVKFNKTSLTEMIDLAMVFSGFNRTPLLNLFVGAEQIAAQIVEGDHKFLDVFDVAGQATHKRITIDFTPRYLQDALAASPNEQVTFCYDATNSGLPIRIDGGSSYEAWVMPRRKGETQEPDTREQGQEA